MLSSSLRIGRTPIREALQRLAREGLITILPRKGILVSETDPRKQLLVLEVRRELERLLSRLGAERATDEQRRQLPHDRARAWIAPPRPTTIIAFMRLDRELNVLIVEAAQNEYAARAMSCCRAIRAGSGTCTTGRRPTCRCARGCTPARRAPSPTATEGGGRGSGPADRLCRNFTRATVMTG